MKPEKSILVMFIVVALLGGCAAPSASPSPVATPSTAPTSKSVTTTSIPVSTTVCPSTTTAKTTTTKTTIPAITTTTQTVTTSTSIQGIPATSACAVTAPPASMDGINTLLGKYTSGQADPNLITLGPKLGYFPDAKYYTNKKGMEFELAHGTPVLAPIDMVFIGFSDSSAEYRIQSGVKHTPYDDLLLCFESASPEWPGMIVLVYHLLSSPLLPGQNPDNDVSVEWGTKAIVQGHLYAEFEDNEITKGNPGSYQALIGYTIKRGEVIGYAGNVGTHSMAAFCFKVKDTSVNPTVLKGNQYLHWVQPGSFFYWKSYSPDATFPSGVLAYPFECDGYQLPAEQRLVDFKYTPKK